MAFLWEQPALRQADAWRKSLYYTRNHRIFQGMGHPAPICNSQALSGLLWCKLFNINEVI